MGAEGANGATHITTVRLDSDLWHWLQELAEAEDRSVSAQLRRIVRRAKDDKKEAAHG